jgi:hypothetical protein
MIAVVDVPVIHLSEADAIRDLASIFRHIDSGSEVVVVERETVQVAIIRPAPRRGRPLLECLKLAEGSAATLHSGFGAELEDLIRSHEPLNSTWD